MHHFDLWEIYNNLHINGSSQINGLIIEITVTHSPSVNFPRPNKEQDRAAIVKKKTY